MLHMEPLVGPSPYPPSPRALTSQSVFDDAPRSACRAVHGAVEAPIRLANPDRLSAKESNLYVTSLIRATAGSIDVREAHDNCADPPKDAGKSGMEPLFDV